MKKVGTYLLLYFALILYSLTSIVSKYASAESFLSFRYLVFMGIQFGILAVYAVLWQSILKKIPLFVAYSCKGMTIFLGMVFGYFLFQEKVTLYNIIGTAIIAVGTIIMTTEDMKR